MDRLTHRTPRSGFTAIEMVVVVVIAGVLVTLAAPPFQRAVAQREVTGARDNVMLLAARARARAVERSRTVEFRLDTQQDRALVVEGTSIVEQIDVRAERGVDIEGDGSYRLCYTARGFAAGSCTNVTTPVDVTFSRGDNSAQMTIWALGQVTTP